MGVGGRHPTQQQCADAWTQRHTSRPSPTDLQYIDRCACGVGARQCPVQSTLKTSDSSTAVDAGASGRLQRASRRREISRLSLRARQACDSQPAESVATERERELSTSATRRTRVSRSGSACVRAEMVSTSDLPETRCSSAGRLPRTEYQDELELPPSYSRRFCSIFSRLYLPPNRLLFFLIQSARSNSTGCT